MYMEYIYHIYSSNTKFDYNNITKLHLAVNHV